MLRKYIITTKTTKTNIIQQNKYYYEQKTLYTLYPHSSFSSTLTLHIFL